MFNHVAFNLVRVHQSYFCWFALQLVFKKKIESPQEIKQRKKKKNEGKKTQFESTV